MKIYFHSLAAAMILMLPLASCDKDNKGDNEPEYVDNSLFESLVGTSWKTKSTTFYTYSNNVYSTYDKTSYPTVITFTNLQTHLPPMFDLWVDMDPRDPGASFYGYKSGQTQVWYWEVKENYIDGFAGAGNCLGEVIKLSATELHTKEFLNEEKVWYRIDEYVRVGEPYHNFKDNEGGGSGGGGSSSDYEKQDIYYSDFTPGTTTLKVVFRIGNKDRTKVTSAKGYCGSKSANGSIGSGTITFNFSGLTRGTKYNVYCTVNGPGGSATSDKVTLSTLY